MAQRGPLVTAVVVVGGLVGLMTANSAGGLVTAERHRERGRASPRDRRSEQPPAAAQPPATRPRRQPPTATVPTTTTEEPPPPPAFPAEAVYAGKAAGVPLWIAVAVKGEEASAYVCDGETVEVWLKGTAVDGGIDIASKDGASHAVGALEGEALAGSVTVAGNEPHDFTIAPAPPPAGLYRGEDGETPVGWIVMPNGKVIGVAKTPSGNVARAGARPGEGRRDVRRRCSCPRRRSTGDTTFG